MINCAVCNKPIKAWKTDRRKFCSTQCKGKFYQNSSYQKQQERGIKRKLEFILQKGGKCQVCGYNKNFAALCFHHINPDTKEISLDIRKFSNCNLDDLTLELEKCQLLCQNCHTEHHNPHCSLDT